MTLTGRIIGYLVAGAIAAALLLFVSHKVDGWFGGNADAATTAASKNQIKLHASQLKIRAHLRAVEQQHYTLSLSFLALADALTDSAPPATTPGERAWKHIADVTRQGAAACFQALTACQLGRENAETENAALVAQLERQIGVRDYPWGVFLGGGGGIGAKGFDWVATLSVGRRLIRIPWLP